MTIRFDRVRLTGGTLSANGNDVTYPIVEAAEAIADLAGIESADVLGDLAQGTAFEVSGTTFTPYSSHPVFEGSRRTVDLRIPAHIGEQYAVRQRAALAPFEVIAEGTYDPGNRRRPHRRIVRTALNLSDSERFAAILTIGSESVLSKGYRTLLIWKGWGPK